MWDCTTRPKVELYSTRARSYRLLAETTEGSQPQRHTHVVLVASRGEAPAEANHNFFLTPTASPTS